MLNKQEIKKQMQNSIKPRDVTARTILNRSKVKELTMRPVYDETFKELLKELEEGG